MNLEQLTTINIKTDEVKEISEACNKLTSQNQKVETLEKSLKEAEEEARRLSEEVIPTLMQQAGVSSIKLDNGTSVEVSPYYYAKISEDRKAEAFQWLRENDHGDLIKNNVSVSFGKGEDSNAVNLKSELEAKGLVVDQKQDVHWQTLRGFVKEQIEKNKTLPSETFGLYIANRTKIKTNK
jgi:16S rRNA C1402 N4-methylase RsmH|tara:strand:+ start:66 stop:608 length:543 start_codon:yes stop_codon:yes gene_type:complete